MQIEEWRDIAGFQGKYQVSNLGRVKSLGNDKKRKEKILLGSKNRKGYKMVCLYKNGKSKWFFIHRLVYEAFVGFITDGLQIDHVSNNKTDNRLQNLQLLTRSENNKKKFADNPMLRYVKATKIKCIETNQIFSSQSEASKKMNLRNQSINRVLKGKRKHTGGYSFEYV